jgi:hypothetical protein
MARRAKPPGLLDAGKVYQQLAHPRAYSLYDDGKPKFSQPPKKDDDEIKALIRHVHVPEITRRRGAGDAQRVVIPPTPAPPVNFGAPSIFGSAVVGQTLSTTNGSWTGYPTPSYDYQWKRGAVNVGTNSSSYLLVTADVGANITVTVTATNSEGSANATSSAVGPVTGVPGVGVAAPSLTWISDSLDLTPNFAIDLPSGLGAPDDAVAGDVIYLEITDNVDFTTTSTDTLDAGEVTGDLITIEQTTPLANGTYYARARLKRGSTFGPYSNVVSKTLAASTFALSYQSSAATTSTVSPVDYGSLAYAAGATRTVCVVQWHDGTAPGISGINVGGVSFTQVTGAYAITADANVDVWISNSPLPAGPGSVTLTYLSKIDWSSAVALYNLTTTNPTAGTPAIGTRAGAFPTITAGPVSIPVSGGAIFATFPYSGTTASVSSGNAVIDASPAAGGKLFYFGHTTATGSQSVTLTYGVNDGGIMTLVPWGP